VNQEVFIPRTVALHVNCHLTLACEFQRVPRQIDEHLPQSGGIAADDVGDVRSNVPDQLDAFLLRADGERLQGFFNAVFDGEVLGIQFKFAGFDL